jgi:penicillin-binding protein 1A
VRRKSTANSRRLKTYTNNSPNWQIFVKGALIILLIAAIPVGYFIASFYQQLKDLPDISILEKYDPIEAIQIYDRNDHFVACVEGDEDRRVIPLNQVSNQMQQAMLAAEDHHFYEHHGINLGSIFRAMITNLQAGHVVEGGSTITQQLVKNLFFEESGRTMDRKIKEAFISSEIERRYSKDKILELYLNQVYFGNGAYGIERAASRYFDKNAASLSLAESAFLAGLVKAPSEMGTEANRKYAITRQHEILDKMVEYGYITAKQAKQAKAQNLKFKKGIDPLKKYPYYISYVLQLLRGRFSPTEMRRQGLRVYTNLDPQVQELAESTLTAAIKKAPKGVSQGALVCVSVKDASVLALVGGVGNFWKNQWNRATNPHTAGSSFKPFVYLTAFIKNTYQPNSIIDDSPLTIKQGWGLPDWSPKNFDHKFMGKIPVRKALALSRNVPAVRVGKAVGIDNVIETARLAGITTKLDPNLSLSLGSSAVTPLDMASAYSTFARSGVAIKPRVLRRIENNRGQIIEIFEPAVTTAFPADPTARLVDVLQDVVKHGTGTQARLKDRPVAGKTGTADAGKDIWFIGFTPDLVAAVWGGNDDNLAIPGHNVTGGVIMAKIWHDFMQAYYTKHPTPPGSFLPPSKLVETPTTESGATEDAGESDASTNLPKLVPVGPEQNEDATINAAADTSTTNGNEMPPVAPDVNQNHPAPNPSPNFVPNQ